MSWSKRILLFLALILATGIAYIADILEDKTTLRRGALVLNGIDQPVEVVFDRWGIPHIYTTKEQNAMVALGFVHAQDRLFQMDLNRRIGSGQLSELLGRDFVETDKFFLTLGIKEFAREKVIALQQDSGEREKNILKLLDAYIFGINQYILTQAKPIEYQLLDESAKLFTREDSYYIIGYLSYLYINALKIDPIMSFIKQELGDRYYSDLALDLNPLSIKPDLGNNPLSNPRSTSPVKPSINTELAAALIQHIGTLTTPQHELSQFYGSNAVAISSAKSQNQAPLLANDPHIQYSTPAVWYESHLVTDEYEIYGHYIPGIPFPLLGHNRHHGWGITMLLSDDMDLYQEQSNPLLPNQVILDNLWVNLTLRTETINVKNEGSIEFEVRQVNNRPIITDLLKNSPKESLFSMFWTFTDRINNPLKSFYNISHAYDIQSFEAALSLHVSPGINFVYADIENNIALWAGGKIPKRAENVDSQLIQDGSTSSTIINEYYDFDKNPKIINPSAGYVFSGNDAYPNADELKGYYVINDRAVRLKENLENKISPWSSTDLFNLQKDDYSSRFIVFKDTIIPIIEQIKPTESDPLLNTALYLLKNWDGRYTKRSIEATLFEQFYYSLLIQIFSDEIPNTVFADFLKTTIPEHAINTLLNTPSSIWWDNINTLGLIESHEDIIKIAFSDALSTLIIEYGNNLENWEWGKIHTLTHRHPIAKNNRILSFLFNVGPFPMEGARETLNSQYFHFNAKDKSVHLGPSTRRVLDFSDITRSYGINPVGQSGNIFDPHYKDQAEYFLQGQYRLQVMGRDEILDSTENILLFQPL